MDFFFSDQVTVPCGPETQAEQGKVVFRRQSKPAREADIPAPATSLPVAESAKASAGQGDLLDVRGVHVLERDLDHLGDCDRGQPAKCADQNASFRVAVDQSFNAEAEHAAVVVRGGLGGLAGVGVHLRLSRLCVSLAL